MNQDVIGELMDLWTNDPSFRTAVKQNPEQAVQQHGIKLSADELAALQSVDWNVPDAELQSRVTKCG